MTRTTDPNTLLQLWIRGQNGGLGQRTVSDQFRGLYDGTIYSVDSGAETCMVIVPAYNEFVPLGPSPYFGTTPTPGTACVVGFITPPPGGQGEIQPRVIAHN